MKDLEILAPCALNIVITGITRMEVIEDSADAFTQHSDAHTIAKYEGNLKTKHRDRIHTFYRYFIDICRWNNPNIRVSRKEN